MFTGLVEEIGTVKSIRARGAARELVIAAKKVLDGVKVDDSICINGVCLTVIDHSEETFSVQVVEETLRKTNLGNLNTGSPVNLERALRPSDRLGGHFVQGHVEGLAKIVEFAPQATGKLMSVELPQPLLRYVIPQGSLALDGVSLTVARIAAGTVIIALIPHTLECTTLGRRRVGDTLNVETDMIGKYVERMALPVKTAGLTPDQLREWGYSIE